MTRLKNLPSFALKTLVGREAGYVLEVDIENSRDSAIHDRHRDLPYCPERRRAPVDQLPFLRHVHVEFGVGKSRKLMATLMDKERYVIHYHLLQLAVEN